MSYLQPLLGIVVLILTGWVFSEARQVFRWRFVVVAVLLQFGLALLLTKVPVLTDAIFGFNYLVVAIEKATKAGSGFMFGYLGGADLPFEMGGKGTSFIVAFQVLPIVLVVSAIASVLYHWGLIQRLARLFAALLSKSLRSSGVMNLGVAASIFLGIIETPLFIKPYLTRMSRSELFTVLSAGMATVAGTTMVLYASILNEVIEGAAGHILTASVISAPAAILMAQIMIPQSGREIQGVVGEEKNTESALDALVQGTMDGLQMVFSIAAIIIVLFAVVNLADQVLSFLPDVDGNPFGVERVLGWFFMPFCWLMGLSWEEAGTAGQLMATKTVLNEFVAYLNFAEIDGTFSAKSRMILLYAMCGSANFGSAGILIGGLGIIFSDRRKELIGLCLKAILAGTMATMLTGCVVSIVL